MRNWSVVPGLKSVLALVILFVIGSVAAAQEAAEQTSSSVEIETITTESGLKYMDLKVGDGAVIENGTPVVVYYTLWLNVDGEKGRIIDSSHDREQEFPFTVGQKGLIQGWNEGMVGMKIGGKRQIYVPSDLGYGPNGRPPEIPGGADLIFEIDAIEALTFEDLVVGEGVEAQDGNNVETHYTLWLSADGEKGEKLDSSYDRDKTLSFMIGQRGLIPGWSIGVIGMKPGGKRLVKIPSAFGYGPQGRAPKVPPNADLMFEIELVSYK